MKSRVMIVSALALVTVGCVLTESEGDTDGSTSNGGTQTSAATTSGTAAPTTGVDGSSGDAGSEAGSSGSEDTGDSANERCDAFCADLVGAACESGPTPEGCLLTCRTLTSSPTCDELGNAYFDCVEGAGVTCNVQGEPVAEACGIAYLEAIGCAVEADPNPDIVEPCMDNCDNIAAAECPLNGTTEACNTNCRWLGAKGTGCDDEWATYLECFNSSTVSCLLGFAVAEGCGPDFGTYTECINEAGM